MKKIVCIIISFTMIFTFSIHSLAESNDIIFKEEDILITTISRTKNYEKLKLVKNDSIEYLESFLEVDGSYLYKITKEDNIYTIKNVEDEILIFDKDNKIFDRIQISDEFKMGFAGGPLSIPNSQWTATHNKGYSSNHIYWSDVSLTAGIIAGIALKPIGGVITAIAIWYCSRKSEQTFYYYEEQTRVYNGWVQRRRYVLYYTNSDCSEVVDYTYSEPQNYYRVY